MLRSIRFPVLAVFFVVAVVLLAIQLVPVRGTGTPYVSALSDLTVGTAQASHKPCDNSTCVAPDRRICFTDTPGVECSFNASSGNCQTKTCN